MPACAECGTALDPAAQACPNCGRPTNVQVSRVGPTYVFCRNCRAQVSPQARVCPKCGVPLAPLRPTGGAEKKLAAGLTGILLGSLGVHKFILGYTRAGLIMLLVSVLTLGFGSIPMAVIGIIEGI